MFSVYPKEVYKKESDTDTASENEDTHSEALPVALTTLYNPSYNTFSPVELRGRKDGIYMNIILTIEDTIDFFQYLEEMTRQQSESPLWFTYRCGRITASKVHDVVVCRSWTTLNNLLNSVMQYSDTISTPATSRGQKYEKKL